MPLTAFLAVLAGALVQGASGFAFSLVALPVLASCMPASEAVPVLTLAGLAVNGTVLLSTRRGAATLEYLPMTVCAVLATWPGTLLLRSLPAGPMRIVAGSAVFVTSVLYLGRVGAGEGRGVRSMIPAGLLSGLLNGLLSLGGPPAIILLAGRRVPRDEFRAGLSMHFLILNVATIPMQAAGGLLSARTATLALEALPLVLAGTLAGTLVARRIPQDVFRRLVLCLLAALGLVTVLTSV
jgi:hypothetical protein